MPAPKGVIRGLFIARDSAVILSNETPITNDTNMVKRYTLGNDYSTATSLNFRSADKSINQLAFHFKSTFVKLLSM